MRLLETARCGALAGGYSLVACLVAEVVLTFMFLMIILGTTDRRAPQGIALGKRGPPTPTACSSSWSSIATGLGLTLIHLIWIPVTNLSVNPARRTGSALLVGGWAVQQLWLFWVAPLAGAVLLYGSNTLLVTGVLCLSERKPMRDMWQPCYFWSFPYYLVGTAASGLMIATARGLGWWFTFLVLPLLTLVYVSYRLYVTVRATAPVGA